jgi:hypothetical protein
MQSNPSEFSVVSNDAPIDVHGWAEPGTTITINGQKVPVAADGLFLKHVAPSREGTVMVQGRSDKGEKAIIRKFRLMYPRPNTAAAEKAIPGI